MAHLPALNLDWPAFDIQGGLFLVAARGVFIAASFSAAGGLAVLWLTSGVLAGTPPDIAARLTRRLWRLSGVSLLVGLAAGTIWFVGEAANLADPETVSDLVDVLPTVATDTFFGEVLLAQMAALLAARLILWRGGGWRAPLGCLLCVAAVLLQAGHGHAAAMYTSISGLLLADGAHLLAGALWLGGLVPLLLLVRDAPPRVGAGAARRFAAMGRLCVLGLIGSAAVQGWVLIGSLPGLIHTAYGWVVLMKSLLLVALLWFAARNRYRLAPGLLSAAPERARRALSRSIALQTAFAVAVIAAAAVLTSLPPAMRMPRAPPAGTPGAPLPDGAGMGDMPM
jgi:putative copper export protein